MFDSGYPCVNLGKDHNNPFIDPPDFLYTCRHRFVTERKDVYLVEVKCFQPSIYIVEFYLRKDRFSRKREKYGKITNRGNAFKVISTCFKVMASVFQQDRLASFAFIGAASTTPFMEENEMETQRFRIYRYASLNLFDEILFEQLQNAEKSGYLILNNKADKPVVKAKVEVILGCELS